MEDIEESDSDLLPYYTIDELKQEYLGIEPGRSGVIGSDRNSEQSTRKQRVSISPLLFCVIDSFPIAFCISLCYNEEKMHRTTFRGIENSL